MIKTTFGGDGAGSGEDLNLASIANDQMARVYAHCPEFFEDLRTSFPDIWAAVRDQAAARMTRAEQEQFHQARGEYRALGLACWLVAALALLLPWPYHLTMIAVAAIGAYAQYQSTDRRPR